MTWSNYANEEKMMNMPKIYTELNRISINVNGKLWRKLLKLVKNTWLKQILATAAVNLFKYIFKEYKIHHIMVCTSSCDHVC